MIDNTNKTDKSQRKLIRKTALRSVLPWSPFKPYWSSLSLMTALTAFVASGVAGVLTGSLWVFIIGLCISLFLYVHSSFIMPAFSKWSMRRLSKRLLDGMRQNQAWTVSQSTHVGSSTYETFLIPSVTMEFRGKQSCYPVFSEQSKTLTDKFIKSIENDMRIQYQENPTVIGRSIPDRGRPYTVVLMRTQNGNGRLQEDSGEEMMRSTALDYEINWLGSKRYDAGERVKKLGFDRIEDSTVLTEDTSESTYESSGDILEDLSTLRKMADDISSIEQEAFLGANTFELYSESIRKDAGATERLLKALNDSSRTTDLKAIQASKAQLEAHVADVIYSASKVYDALSEFSVASYNRHSEERSKQLVSMLDEIRRSQLESDGETEGETTSASV